MIHLLKASESFRSVCLFLLLLFSLSGWAQKEEPRVRPNVRGAEQRVPASGEGVQGDSASNAIKWKVDEVRMRKGRDPLDRLTCEGCGMSKEGLPVQTFTKQLGECGVQVEDVEVRLKGLSFKKLNDEERKALGEKANALSESIRPEKRIVYSRKRPYLKFSFVPLVKGGSGSVKKLMARNVQVGKVEYGSSSPGRAVSFASHSVLRSGDWYKVGVTESGVHAMGRSFLKELGVSVGSIDPTRIAVHGNGFGMLPFDNSKARPDDLKENAIAVEGGADGSFDAGDQILFYAKGPHVWEQNSLTARFEQRRHHYTDTAWYFLRVGSASPDRVSTESKVTTAPDETVEAVNVMEAHENDRTNLIESGRQWAGEEIQDGSSKSVSFDVGRLEPGSKVHVRTRVLTRTLGLSNSSSFGITVNGQTSKMLSVGGVNDNYLAPQGNFAATTLLHNVGSNENNVKVEVGFNGHAPSSKGWLDRIVVNAERRLELEGAQMSFRDTSSVGSGNIAEFRFYNSGQVERIWDISAPTNVRAMPFDKVNGSPRFRAKVDSLRHFVAFDPDELPTPTSGGKVPNQDLHGNDHPDMVIVSGKAFMSSARELASFHRQRGLDVLTTDARKVYNEFSGGLRDVTAIKDLLRMFYVRAGTDSSLMPDHLLLMGDGSFANKLPEMDQKSLPTYQSANSVNPTESYTSDDYFGLLDSMEADHTYDLVDVGIGRLPVNSDEEAKDMVDKIKAYAKGDNGISSSGAACGPQAGSVQDPNWRDLVVFVADDEDGNLHMQDAEDIAGKVRNLYPVMNLRKVYMDAFQQTTASGGERYPEVNERINERMAQGALIFNYIGHGGEDGLAHERVVTQKMIREWENMQNLPLFVTATCEFTRFDDHTFQSAGENVILNPNGGAIGLLSTTRVVYASQNKALNKELYQHALKSENGEPLRMGEIVRRTKVGIAQSAPNSINHRKFLYFGDPALRLNLPSQELEVDSINASSLGSPSDTIRALSEVSVSGSVLEDDGSLDKDFQGVVHPVVMDKQQSIETLANDGGNKMTFKSFNSWLHRGKATVENGKFEFAFVVPKDIAYQFGNGRISLLANGNGSSDAHGYTENFIIGGTDPNARADDRGPDIGIFMNDKDFVPGGTTDEDPLMLAELKDQSGINISSSGIGHDIKATLDGDRSDAVLLNEQYRSDLDTYKKGQVKYRFQGLEEGEHTIKLKAWDVHNNPSERKVDFLVANSAELALEHVLNYPNPFTTKTEFFFEHNQACNYLDVRIRIFTVSGRVVKTIDRQVHSEGFRSDGIAWNGTDRFGDQLGKGVYVYELKVRTPDGKKASKFEKLVILK